MAKYYVRFDTYWQGSRDRFVGPFATREEAEAAIDTAENASGSKVVRSGHMAHDVRNGIRVHGVLSATEAKRHGLKNNYEALDEIPLDTSELNQAESAQIW